MAEGTGADQWEKCPNFSSFASVALLTPEKRCNPACFHRPKLERLGEPKLQKIRQFRCCIKLRNRIQFLEGLSNAFERLHIVRGANSSYCGLKYRSCTLRARC